MKRYIQKWLEEDLKEKMVFLGGPRQVGKTTVSFHLLGKPFNENHPSYFNWDNYGSRNSLLKGEIPPGPLVVFDEIHKYKDWRNLVKGIYDKNKSSKHFLITGSARLDYYRRGGDSLQGRYHYHRLHPFSLFEINPNPTLNDLKTLIEFGGFPEPFLKGQKKHWKRWQNERSSRVIQEDLINLEKVKELSHLDLLVSILPQRVGSILSVNNLKTDLSISFETTERYLSMLENLYYCFRISPFGINKLRTAKKEKKLYLWDWSLCEDKGPRFENIVASNLLKFCHFHTDTQGDQMELCFLRDAEKREIDFIVVKNKKPLMAIECKSGEKGLSPHISYFAQRSDIPIFYQVHMGKKDYELKEHRARVIPFTQFSKLLKI